MYNTIIYFIYLSVPPARPNKCNMDNSSTVHEINEVTALSDTSLVIGKTKKQTLYFLYGVGKLQDKSLIFS